MSTPLKRHANHKPLAVALANRVGGRLVGDVNSAFRTRPRRLADRPVISFQP
jgi:hypothetical protein